MFEVRSQRPSINDYRWGDRGQTSEIHLTNISASWRGEQIFTPPTACHTADQNVFDRRSRTLRIYLRWRRQVSGYRFPAAASSAVAVADLAPWMRSEFHREDDFGEASDDRSVSSQLFAHFNEGSNHKEAHGDGSLAPQDVRGLKSAVLGKYLRCLC